jgi:hypothetical protein
VVVSSPEKESLVELVAEARRLRLAEADAMARYDAHVEGCGKQPVRCDEFMAAHHARRAVGEFARKHDRALLDALLAAAEQLEAATKRAEELLPLARLGMAALDASGNGYDVDGYEIQEKAVECGVLAPTPMPGSCDDGERADGSLCACDEFTEHDKPRTCIRYTEATRRVAALLAEEPARITKEGD